MKFKLVRFSIDIFSDGSLRFYKSYLLGFFLREVKTLEEQNKIKEMVIKA